MLLIALLLIFAGPIVCGLLAFLSVWLFDSEGLAFIFAICGTLTHIAGWIVGILWFVDWVTALAA